MQGGNQNQKQGGLLTGLLFSHKQPEPSKTLRIHSKHGWPVARMRPVQYAQN